MPKKKTTKIQTLELSSAVDIPVLKDMFKSAGCVIPQGFDVELEKYLRMLMARYIPRDVKESYRNTSLMSKAMRSLFSKNLYTLTSRLMITEDKKAIRIWDREFFDPKRGLIKLVPDRLNNHLARLFTIKDISTGFLIEPSRITRLIPRAIQSRKGYHKYILFKFGQKHIAIVNSQTLSNKKSEVCVLSDTLATNLLALKDRFITARMIRLKGSRHLLLTGSRFEIFFK